MSSQEPKAVSREGRVGLRFALASLAAMLAATILAAPALADRAITPRFTANEKGNLVHTGNTLMTCPAADVACASAQAGTATGAAANNNNYAMEYVDVDADATTFNSSTANLTLPAGAEVLFAGLYYSGNTAAGGEPERATTLVDTPAAGGYVTVTADQLDDFTSSDPNQHIYGGFADITALVDAGGSGSYTVANVQAAVGADHHAGWGIVVAYRDQNQVPRNLTVFDGLIGINPNDPDVNFTLSGFQTSPVGAVNADLGFIVWEGDRGLLGDEVLFEGTSLSDANNPATNFNNSTISFSGTHFAGKTPNFVNQLGYDNDVINADGLLTNNQTSANLTLRTTGDRWVPQVITFAPEIYSPDIDLQKTAVDLNGGQLIAGDVVEYRVTGTNIGQETASDVIVTDPIPSGTTYVPGSLSEAVGANAGAKTDLAADDQGEFQAGLNRTRFRIGTGADGTQGGLLAQGEDFEVRFRVQVNAGTAVGTDITNTATADYSGETTGIDYTVDASVQVTTASPLADLKVVKTITHGFPRVGNQLTYRVTVTNQGPDTATDVVVEDTLDGSAELVSVATSGGTCSNSLPMTCSLGALGPGESVQITVIVKLVQEDRLVNTATASSPEADPDLSNNTDDAVANVAGPRTSVTLRKVATKRKVGPGERFAYRISFTNQGPGPALDVRICDQLPKQIRFVSAPGGGAYNTSRKEICWTRDSVGVGAELQLTLNVRATRNLPKKKKVRNLVIATGSNFPEAKAAAYILCGRTVTQ